MHEEKFLPKYSQCVVYYRRFIDDVIGIWCPNQNSQADDTEWTSFINTMNVFPGLTWEFSEQSNSVDFMDMTITINKANKIETTIFEKKMNLQLYIPPHSAHPPWLLPGIVYSTLFRIFTLCSSQDDKANHTKVFFKRLITREYKRKRDPIPISHSNRPCENLYWPHHRRSKNNNDVILHLPFHPNDPSSHPIQQAWRTHVSRP